MDSGYSGGSGVRVPGVMGGGGDVVVVLWHRGTPPGLHHCSTPGTPLGQTLCHPRVHHWVRHCVTHGYTTETKNPKIDDFLRISQKILKLMIFLEFLRISQNSPNVDTTVDTTVGQTRYR